jgi:hypothetical protein
MEATLLSGIVYIVFQFVNPIKFKHWCTIGVLSVWWIFRSFLSRLFETRFFGGWEQVRLGDQGSVRLSHYCTQVLKCIPIDNSQITLIMCVLSKQWPLAPNSPKWRITRANVSRRVTFFSKSPLANVSECIESELSRVANLANLANF